MDNFKYIYLFNDELDEDFLDENLPRDLAMLYKEAAYNKYDMNQNPTSDHQELGRKSRRSMMWDYGKSTYTVISPDDAIALVKQDKNNVSKLRIIFNSHLVEFEVRPNGSIYAVYRENSPVEIDGKQYKNIGYVSWKKVIENADKIYVTDEYDHPLSADDIRNRETKKNIYTLHTGIDSDDPDYDPHNQLKNKKNKKGLKFFMDTPDTGAHSIPNISYTSNNLDGQNLVTVKDYFAELINALKKKKNAYINYDNIRRAMKKFENERDQFDDEEYEERLQQLTAIKQDYEAKYKQATKDALILRQKVATEVDSASIEFDKKIIAYLTRVQDALDKGFELKKQLEQLQVANVNDTMKNNYSYRSVYNAVLQSIKDLTADRELLKQAQERGQDQSSIQSSIEEKSQKLKTRLQEFSIKQEQLVKEHLQKIADIQNELSSVDATLATLQPKAAAAKAARQAKNKAPELDTSLVNIIDFSDLSAE